MKSAIMILITSLTLVISGLAFSEEGSIAYPEDYRQWSHIKTMLIEPGHQLENPFQGIHHIYANQEAYKGLESGEYPDGSILVFDLLNYIEKDKTIQEGERKLVGVMVKDAKKYAETGGWGFEGFAGNSRTDRLVSDGGTSCFGCHAPQKAGDFVYSKLRK